MDFNNFNRNVELTMVTLQTTISCWKTNPKSKCFRCISDFDFRIKYTSGALHLISLSKSLLTNIPPLWTQVSFSEVIRAKK